MKHIQAILFALLTLLLFPGCQSYDRLIEADSICDEKWANLEAQLQRRWDLLPALVKTVKAGAENEKAILDSITANRAEASKIELNVYDEKSLNGFMEAQNRSFAYGMKMIQEAYPDLESTEGFLTLQAQIEGTENRILVARRDYNEAVRVHNVELGKVRGAVINSATGKPFQKRAFFSADSAAHSMPAMEF